MKKYISGLLMAVVMFMQGCNEDISTEPTSVLLPLYSYPTGWKTNTELSDLINATDGEFISIINPSDGPGLSQNTDYVDGIDYLYSKNTKIVGYIYTSRGSRDIQDIYDDIDNYVAFYGTEKLTGIFFDEVSLNNDANQTYVKDISEYARSRNLDYIVLNPGRSVDQSIVDENYYDLIVTYENSYENYLLFENSVLSSSRTKQSLLVYNYVDLISYADEVQKAKDMNFDFIYLTIDPTSNPWATVFNFLK
jgi:hypothetical protein